MAEKLKHYEDGFTTTTEKDGGREQEAVVNTEPGEVHSPEILAKDVKEIVEEADRKQDQHLLENYYDKDEMDELYYDKTETNALLETKQDVIDGDVESGTVASMLGLDSEGNLVKGSVPSGSVVDSELDPNSTNPVENKAIAQGFADVENGTRVAGKSLTAEQLENVSDESGSTQTSPFNFQATGTDDNTTETPTAPIAKHLELRGNSIAWNQSLDNTYASIWNRNRLSQTFSNGVWTFTTTEDSYAFVSAYIPNIGKLIKGHKYLTCGKIRITSGNCSYIKLQAYNTDLQKVENPTANTWYYLSGIWQNTVETGLQTPIPNFERGYSSTTDIVVDSDTFELKEVMLIDLTLLGKEYDSVLAFNSDYPLPYYEYNAGQLISCKCNKLITVGYNQFDGETVDGYIDSSGNVVPESNASKSSANFIKAIPGQTYTLEVDKTIENKYIVQYDGNKNIIEKTSTSTSTQLKANTQYIKIQYKTSPYDATAKACLHLTWDSSRTGDEEYVKKEYDLPNVELRSAGTVYDEITPDGTKTTRIGVYTFTGSETFIDFSGAGKSLTIELSGAKPTSSDNDIANIKWALGVRVNANSVNNDQPEYTVALNTNGRLYIATTKNSSQLASALAGKTIQFELATPTTDTTSTFTENIVVDDFGTMDFVSAFTESASNPIVPQGNQFFYPADYVLLLDDLNNYLDDNEISVSGLALKKELLPKLPSTSEDGTYTLKAIKSGTTITYSWVLDE